MKPELKTNVITVEAMLQKGKHQLKKHGTKVCSKYDFIYN
jgi:hypothetical protein